MKNGKTPNEDVLNVVRNSNKPVHVSFVSQMAGISWGTAKETLLELAAKGEISFTDTTGGLIFSKVNDRG